MTTSLPSFRLDLLISCFTSAKDNIALANVRVGVYSADAPIVLHVLGYPALPQLCYNASHIGRVVLPVGIDEVSRRFMMLLPDRVCQLLAPRIPIRYDELRLVLGICRGLLLRLLADLIPAKLVQFSRTILASSS